MLIVLLCFSFSCCWGYKAPGIDVGATPSDGAPSPEVEMRADNVKCVVPIAAVSTLPSYAKLLNFSAVHKLSQGRGVKVAVISTGVVSNPRLSVSDGGDYVTGGSGLQDCDGLGTMVASIIAARSSRKDRFVGVAPRSEVIGIRLYSQMFRVKGQYDRDDPAMSPSARMVRQMARAVVHAVNLGAGVVYVESMCFPVRAVPDLRVLGAALNYAVRKKNAVVVSASSPTNGMIEASSSSSGCPVNPDVNPGSLRDYRNWSGVQAVSVPSVFTDLVVSVAQAHSNDGQVAPNSVQGPWVSVAAPGEGVKGFSWLDHRGVVVDRVLGKDGPVELSLPSYSAAVVAGEVALVRSYYPRLSAFQVRLRIEKSAHNGVGINNLSGFGLIDPLLAVSGVFPSGDVGLPVVVNKYIDPLPEVVVRKSHTRQQVVVVIFIVLASVFVIYVVSSLFQSKKSSKL